MHALYLASVSLHLLAVAVWIGGMVALVAVMVPVLRRQQTAEMGRELMWQSGVRLRVVAWVALSVLVVTGAFQAGYRVGAATLLDAAFWGGAWGRLLAAKLAVVTAILALAALHDFRIGPRAMALARRDPAAPEAARLRRTAAAIGRTELLLSLGALVLGVLLVRGA